MFFDGKQIDAVLFDMDGLLIDSERPSCRLCLNRLRELGFLNADKALVQRTIGTRFEECNKLFSQALGPTFDPDKLWPSVNAQMRYLCAKGEIPLMPGIKKLLSFLQKHQIPCIVASSSPMDMIISCLTANNIMQCFADIASGQHVRCGKPDPEIFLLAASKAGVSPEKCLVLEDAPVGVTAGKRAGATTVMIPSLIPFTQDLQPVTDYVFEQADQLIPLFK